MPILSPNADQFINEPDRKYKHREQVARRSPFAARPPRRRSRRDRGLARAGTTGMIFQRRALFALQM
ncbi:hypothetical protein EVAR_37577_1 [Eumeta japonica]|uniref:Uncharacterized protein n=1 Tax=Eumeta variegata TaxID=151549 RepID=A0A4C1VM68_EUMVA|nr:hypothetical protein EVAR_37577_1 [Eumeta japonica]